MLFHINLKHYKNSPSTVILFYLTVVSVIHCSPIAQKNDVQNRTHDSSDNDATLFGLYNMFGGGNPTITPEGYKIIEGDIAVTSNEMNQDLSLRKAIPDSSVYWPNGEVIYTYHESITQQEMNVIEAAMQHWSKHTCITFRPKQAQDYLFVRFRSDTQGCWSLVGRQSDRFGQGQDVSIGQGCANLNVVVHEIGHVIGFFHEQSRSDRDEYIDIVWGNVLPGYALQFRKETDSNFNIPYDLTSTMQYPQWAFSKEIFEKSTIVARNPAYQRFLSKNYPLSFRDRQLANALYSCTANCNGQCQNGGYMRSIGLSSFSASQCSCDCPPNFTGSQCETQLRADYYDDLPCGGIITKQGKIETPGYPRRTAPFQSCMWDIRAPEGKRVSIKINGFEFAPRFTKVGTKVINKCFNETVEVRLKNSNIYDGDTYCGTDLAPGTVLQADGSRAVIVITANDRMYGSGMSAVVKFLGGNDVIGGGGDDDDQDDNQQTPSSVIKTTEAPSATTTEFPIYTFPPQPFVRPTLPPMPPPPPPTNVVTISSLLEEYEKESRKTLPPVIPIFQQV